MGDNPWAAGLRRVLSERGWTQGQLADKAGIRAGTISELLRSNRGCQISTLQQLAKALRVPLWEFFVTQEQSELLRQREHAVGRTLPEDDARSVERRLLKRLATLIRDAADE